MPGPSVAMVVDGGAAFSDAEFPKVLFYVVLRIVVVVYALFVEESELAVPQAYARATVYGHGHWTSLDERSSQPARYASRNEALPHSGYGSLGSHP